MQAKKYTESQIINKFRVKGKFTYPQLIGFILLNLSIFSCNPSLGPSHLPESMLNDSLITTPSPSQEPSKTHPQESQILSPESPSNIESPESTSKIYTNSAGMSFVSLPGGNFIMGSPGGLIWTGKDEYPQHSVTVSAFQMMTTEVTKEQWWAVMGSYPFKSDTDFSQDGSEYDYSAGNHYPMYGISWCDIVGKSGDPLHCHIPVGESFLDKLNASGTGTYRLPTEAEWEYAARAGSDTEYACGDWVAYDKDNPDVCPYRVYDKYKQKIAAIAVFAEGKPNWMPNAYEYQFFQTKLSYSYPVYKILDQDESELQQSDNPFAMVILAALYALRSKKTDEERKLHFKLLLTDLLFKKGYETAKIRAVFHFVNTLIKMNDELTQAKFFEEAKNMATLNKKVELLSDFEEVVIRTEKKETASKMKADGMAPELIQKYTGLSLEEIDKLEPQTE